MLMDWCKSCMGRGGSHEDVDSPTYGENVVAWVICSDCEGSGLVRDTDDNAFERRSHRQANSLGE